MRIAGCSALVTGGASGLGRGTATRLVADGAHVVICDLPRSDGAAVAEELGERCTFAPCDVTSEADVTAALDLAEAQAALRIVVNCAGILDATKVIGRDGTVYPMEVFERTVRVNLFGTFNVLRLAAERLAKNDLLDGDRGVIVNTASVAAYDGQIGQAAYASSKAAVAGLTLPMARELAQIAVRVMTIAPGMFQTNMIGDVPPKAAESLFASIPHPSRMGDPAEYAALVAHIVENPMLNGDVIRLDGAVRMAPR